MSNITKALFWLAPFAAVVFYLVMHKQDVQRADSQRDKAVIEKNIAEFNKDFDKPLNAGQTKAERQASAAAVTAADEKLKRADERQKAVEAKGDKFTTEMDGAMKEIDEKQADKILKGVK